MFQILSLYERDSIGILIKHLLYRYEVRLVRNVQVAENIIQSEEISLVIVEIGEPTSPFIGFLKKWNSKKKIIVIGDLLNYFMQELLLELGITSYVDRIHLPSLPSIVETHLNQAKTRVIPKEFINVE